MITNSNLRPVSMLVPTQVRVDTKAVPIWEKYMINIDEGVKYFNIGEHKLRQLVEENIENPDLVMMIGVKRLIKRENFKKFLDELGSV